MKKLTAKEIEGFYFGTGRKPNEKLVALFEETQKLNVGEGLELDHDEIPAKMNVNGIFRLTKMHRVRKTGKIFSMRFIQDRKKAIILRKI